jgi:hypothetical protein
MKHSDIKMDKKVAKKAIGMHDKQMHGGKKTNLASLKKGGMTKCYDGGGSLNMVEKGGKKVPFYAADGVGKMAKGGMCSTTKKYATGGKIKATSEQRLANANRSQSDSDISPNFKSKRARSDGGLQATYDEPKKQTFGEAFKEAKKIPGKKTFMYNGKSYTTETAEEKAKKQSKPTPTGNIGSRVMFEEGETAPAYKRGGMTKMSKGGCAKMAIGGGIEKKGKTRGKII